MAKFELGYSFGYEWVLNTYPNGGEIEVEGFGIDYYGEYIYKTVDLTTDQLRKLRDFLNQTLED